MSRWGWLGGLRRQMWTARYRCRLDRNGLLSTTAAFVWLSRVWLIAAERDQLHSAFGTIGRCRAGDFGMHRTGVKRGGRRLFGLCRWRIFRCLEVQTRCRSAKGCEQKESDEVEMTGDEFHRFQVFKVSWFQFWNRDWH